MATPPQPKKKAPKVTTYLLQNADQKQLDLQFYRGYDEKFLYSKALALHYMAYGLEDQKPFQMHLASIGLKPEEIDEKFSQALRAELYFTAMHQFECLFALLLAEYQPGCPHWFYLSEYQPGEIKKAATLFLEEKISDLIGVPTDTRGFLHQAIYSGFRLEGMSDEEWRRNLDNIAWLLSRMAEHYVKASEHNAGEYNAYKHGLRIMTGPSTFTLQRNLADGTPAGQAMVVGQSTDAVRFLQMEKDEQQDGKIVYHVTKHFNPEESFFYLCKMQQMLETIKFTRLANLSDTSPEDVALFLDLNKEFLIGLKGDGMVFRYTL